MVHTIVCIGGRCSSWGKHWKKHLYDGGETCLRCGMDRKEQFEEDKAAHLVTGDYKPNSGISRQPRKSTSNKLMYCALGEEGIEFVADNVDAVSDWIHEQEIEDESLQDYYSVVTHTKAELDAMPEA